MQNFAPKRFGYMRPDHLAYSRRGAQPGKVEAGGIEHPLAAAPGDYWIRRDREMA